MNWENIKELIGTSAPIVGGLIGGPAGATIGGLVSNVLGVEENPKTVYEELKNNPEAIVKLKEFEFQNKENLLKMRLSAETNKLQIVNDTYREEIKQEDKYVKRWRPTFGYALILTWVMTWSGILYSIIFNVKEAPIIINSLVGTTMLWGVALSVLGIAVHNRSKDKQLLAGIEPKSLIQQITGK